MAGVKGAKWGKRKARAELIGWFDKRADKILARLDRVLESKDDDQVLAMLRIVLPLIVDEVGDTDRSMTIRVISADA
jgi:hypothetical protein